MSSCTASMCSFPKGPVVAALCIVSASLLCCGGEGGRSREGESSSPVVGGPASVAPLAPEEPSRISASGELVLDDLTDGDALFASGSFSGEWFTYSDGTSTVTPPDHTGLIVSDGETHVAGQGFSDWGVGLSAYLRSADLSQFCSLKLRARGTGAIVLEVATPATSPPGEGGTCMGSGCFGHFAANLQLEEAYRDFEIAFTSLLQPSWAQPAALSLTGVLSFNLVAKGSAAAPGNIDLWVDRLGLQACPP